MNIKKAKEIVTNLGKDWKDWLTPDETDALIVALVCMSFAQGAITAQGYDAVGRLEAATR